MPDLMVFAVIGAVAFYQIFVSVTIFRADEYDHKQQWLQFLMIWLLPLIGAVGCHLFLRSQRTPAPRPDNQFVPQEPNGEPYGNE